MPYSGLPLEVLAFRTVVAEGLYDPELPHCIQVELEKVWLLAGSYQVYHEFTNMERTDKQPIADAQLPALMATFPQLPMSGQVFTIREHGDLNKWRIIDPFFGTYLVKPGYRDVGDNDFVNTFFENGGIKEDMLKRDEKGGVGWRGSQEFRLSDEGDLVLVRKRLNKEGTALFTETYLAKRANF
jgi:hypothetical protein